MLNRETSRTPRYRGAALLGGVAIGVCVAATAGVALATSPSEGERRADALLASTRTELAGTSNVVDAIRLAQVVDGTEIYVATGPKSVCLLTTRPELEEGRSLSLSCGVRAASATDRALSDTVQGKTGQRITAVVQGPLDPKQVVALDRGSTPVAIRWAGGIGTGVGSRPLDFQVRDAHDQTWHVAGFTKAQLDEIDENARELERKLNAE